MYLLRDDRIVRNEASTIEARPFRATPVWERISSEDIEEFVEKVHMVRGGMCSAAGARGQ